MRKTDRQRYEPSQIQIVQQSLAPTKLERYLDIRKPSANDVHKQLNDILLNTKPDEIIYSGAGNCHAVDCRRILDWHTMYSRRLSDIDNEKQNQWVLIYKHSAEEQFNLYHYEKLQQKLLAQKLAVFNKTKYLNFNRNKRDPKPRRNVYKPPVIEEPRLRCKGVRYGRHADNEINYNEYIIDLHCNQWLTAFGSAIRWSWSKKYQSGHYVQKIDNYRLLIAVDEEDRKRKRDKKQHGRTRTKNQPSQHNKSTNKTNSNSTARRKHHHWNSRASNAQQTTKPDKKRKWQYIGCLNGNLDGYYTDCRGSFDLEKIHRINYNRQYSLKQSMNSSAVHSISKKRSKASQTTNTTLKNLSKNGKLCRWIKIIPCRYKGDNEWTKKFAFSAYGLKVNYLSEPVLPTSRIASFPAVDDSTQTNVGAGANYNDNDNDNEAQKSGKHLNIRMNSSFSTVLREDSSNEPFPGTIVVITEGMKYKPTATTKQGGMDDQYRAWHGSHDIKYLRKRDTAEYIKYLKRSRFKIIDWRI